MNPSFDQGRASRQLAALVQMRLDTDRNTEDTYRLAEKVLDDNRELEEMLAELRTETEPIRVRQRAEILALIQERDQLKAVAGTATVSTQHMTENLRRQANRKQAEIERLNRALTKTHDRADQLAAQLTEMRDQAEPVLVQQAHDMGILREQVQSRNTEIGELRRRVQALVDFQQNQADKIEELENKTAYTLGDWQRIKSLENRIETLLDDQADRKQQLTLSRARADGLDQQLRVVTSSDNQERRIANYVREINNLDAEIAILTDAADTTRVISLETMRKGDMAYKTSGPNGIDTIDRMRGPIWSDRNRGETGRVHRVGEDIRIGEEVRLAVASRSREWVWVAVQP